MREARSTIIKSRRAVQKDIDKCTCTYKTYGMVSGRDCDECCDCLFCRVVDWDWSLVGEDEIHFKPTAVWRLSRLRKLAD